VGQIPPSIRHGDNWCLPKEQASITQDICGQVRLSVLPISDKQKYRSFDSELMSSQLSPHRKSTEIDCKLEASDVFISKVLSHLFIGVVTRTLLVLTGRSLLIETTWYEEGKRNDFRYDSIIKDWHAVFVGGMPSSLTMNSSCTCLVKRPTASVQMSWMAFKRRRCDKKG